MQTVAAVEHAALTLIEERRRRPRFSDRRMIELVEIGRENETLLRAAREALLVGDVPVALEAVDRALARYPQVWVLREEFVRQLRLELEELRG